MKPFRFGTFPIPFTPTTGPIWTETVQNIEKLGYSTLMYPDHFPKILGDPITLLASAAMTTEKLNLGTLVFDVDFRHPAIYAKAAATLHNLSGGRFEFGIGAGHDKADYNMTGIPFDRPGVRIKRLDEAVQIIKSMWTKDKTTFHGEHYQVTDIEKAGELPVGEHPKLMVGGGGRKLLSLAGRYADIVGIHFTLSQKNKRNRDNFVREMSFEEVNRKIGWVLEAAEQEGRDCDEIEFMLLTHYTKVTSKPEDVLERITSAFTVDRNDLDLEENAWISVGSGSEIVEKLQRLRKETGVNYIVNWPDEADEIINFAEHVIHPLTK
jgi:probable F420-dependent oxidoreductase